MQTPSMMIRITTIVITVAMMVTVFPVEGFGRREGNELMEGICVPSGSPMSPPTVVERITLLGKSSVMTDVVTVATPYVGIVILNPTSQYGAGSSVAL